MRARGGQVADISVVVVAADDGVMPQTREAIDHSRAADVPILVAVNKVDKEGADPTRVRTEMTTLNLQPSEWGGDTEFVDVSAKTRVGLDDLLDTILVVAELEELEANPEAEASGVVIESSLDPGRGPVVTLLVQRGTLRVGDALVAGAHWGKVRAMVAYNGERMEQAVPGDPVEVLGFDSVPDAGEFAHVVENDRTARQQANERAVRLRNEAQARRSGRKVSFEDIFKGIEQGDIQDLDLVLKADVSGSLEAFEDEIAKLPQDEIHVNVISAGVGGITESDVMLAAASDAVVLGFNVRPVGDARVVAEREGVQIRHYSVIYKALDDLRDAMTGMLRPEEVEETVGTVEVRQTFRASRVGTIAGCYVTDGKVTRGGKIRIVRDGTVIYETTDRLAQALQRRRARGRRRLRVRHRPGQLPGRQGRRRVRGLRDAPGRAGAVLGAARQPLQTSMQRLPVTAARRRQVRRPLRDARVDAGIEQRRVERGAVSVQRRLAPAEVVAVHAPGGHQAREVPLQRRDVRVLPVAPQSGAGTPQDVAGAAHRHHRRRGADVARARSTTRPAASAASAWSSIASTRRHGTVEVRAPRLRRPPAHPPALPRLREPQGEAQGALVGQGAAAHPPGRRRVGGRRAGHLAALDPRGRVDQRFVQAAGTGCRPRRGLAAEPLPRGCARGAQPDLVRGRRRDRMSVERMRRVDEAVREVLSDVLTHEVKDPRVGFVTVTDVKTSPDLSHARVYVSVLGDAEAVEASLEGLQSAHGFLQGRVGSELRLKHTPALSFFHDDTAERAQRLERLMDEQA